jgi:hypothetical protein
LGGHQLRTAMTVGRDALTDALRAELDLITQRPAGRR